MKVVGSVAFCMNKINNSCSIEDFVSFNVLDLSVTCVIYTRRLKSPLIFKLIRCKVCLTVDRSPLRESRSKVPCPVVRGIAAANRLKCHVKIVGMLKRRGNTFAYQRGEFPKNLHESCSHLDRRFSGDVLPAVLTYPRFERRNMSLLTCCLSGGGFLL